MPSNLTLSAMAADAEGLITRVEFYDYAHLLGIRSKGGILQPLKPVPPAARQMVKIACLLGLPAAPILWGLVQWRRREAWRKIIAAGFAAKYA